MGLFFKQRGHYVFDYKPLYYDARKEDREKRLRRIKAEMGIKDEETENKEYKPSFDFRRNSITRTRSQRNSSIRLLIILAFMLLFGYFFFFTDLVQQIANIAN